MQPIVWWEIESPDPETFQRFHSALWGWQYEPAFAGTELGADYWIIKAALDPSGVSFGLWTQNPPT